MQSPEENQLTPGQGLPAPVCSRWLSWDETIEVFGGVWEMQTPCGRTFRVELGKRRGLGYYAMGKIQTYEQNYKAAWKIAGKCRFREIEGLHKAGPPIPFENAQIHPPQTDLTS